MKHNPTKCRRAEEIRAIGWPDEKTYLRHLRSVRRQRRERQQAKRSDFLFATA